MFHLSVYIPCFFSCLLYFHDRPLLSLVLLVVKRFLFTAHLMILVIARWPESLLKNVVKTRNWVLSPERVSFVIIATFKYIFKVLVQARKLLATGRDYYFLLFFLFHHLLSLFCFPILFFLVSVLSCLSRLSFLVSRSIPCVKLTKVIILYRLLNCWIWLVKFYSLFGINFPLIYDYRALTLKLVTSRFMILWNSLAPFYFFTFFWFTQKPELHIATSFTFRLQTSHRILIVNKFLLRKMFILVNFLDWFLGI